MTNINWRNTKYKRELNDFLIKNKTIIIDSYIKDKLTLRQIAKNLNIKRSTVYHFLRNNDISIRPYLSNKKPINESYFENIDSHEKAYWLGWLFSDGYMNEKTYKICLKLHEKDVEILNAFKKCLDTEKEFYRCRNKRARDSKRGKAGSWAGYTYEFAFTNKKMVSDLKQFGMKQAKSLILDYPIIHDKYFYSFLCGYILGDGCIYVKFKEPKHKTRFVVYFLGAKNLVKKTLDRLNKDGFNFAVKLAKGCKYTYRATIANKTKILELLNKMFENVDKNILLQRKYNKYLQIKQFLQDHPVQQKFVSNSPKIDVLN